MKFSHLYIVLSALVILLFKCNVFAQDLNDINTYFLSGDYEHALKELTIYVEKNSDDPEGHYQKGLANLALFRFEDALLCFRMALQLAPEIKKYKLSLAQVYVHRGQNNQAEKLFMEILEQSPDDLLANIQLAQIKFKNKSFKPALNRFKKLISLNPANGYFYKQAGIAAKELDSTKTALYLLHQANIKNPDDAEINIHIANIYLKLEQIDPALQIIQNGLERSGNIKSLWRAKADIQYQASNYFEANEAYQQALSLGDSSAGLMQKMGISLYHSNDYPGALLALSIAQEKQKQPATYFYLGLTYKALNQSEIALLMLQTASNLVVPAYMTEIDFQLGVLNEKLENYVEAIKAYKRVLEREPERKLVLFYIASVYDRYYADRTVPLDYYQQFLDEYSGKNENHLEYARQRVEAIIEEIHFSTD